MYSSKCKGNRATYSTLKGRIDTIDEITKEELTPSLARKPESEGLQMIDESQYQKALLLFEQHDKIRYFVIRKYYPTLLYNEDVEQATKCGLWRAAVTYDQNKDCTFSNYAIS